MPNSFCRPSKLFAHKQGKIEETEKAVCNKHFFSIHAYVHTFFNVIIRLTASIRIIYRPSYVYMKIRYKHHHKI